MIWLAATALGANLGGIMLYVLTGRIATGAALWTAFTGMVYFAYLIGRIMREMSK